VPSVLKKFLLCSILRERLESFLFWQFQYLFHQLLWCPSSRHGMGSRKLLPTISQSANKWPTCSSLSLSLFPCHFCWFLESRFNLTKNYDALRNLWSIEQPGCHRKRKSPGQREEPKPWHKFQVPCACKHIGWLRGYLRCLFAVCHWCTGTGPVCKGPGQMVVACRMCRVAKHEKWQINWN